MISCDIFQKHIAEENYQGGGNHHLNQLLMMSKTSEKSLKGKHPTFVCHDISVGKRKRNECKKEEEIN